MKYMVLYQALRDKITQGLWVYGDRIPSKRQLADEYGISLITTEHSLELLCQEGYLEAKQRSGYYVSYRSDDTYALTSEVQQIRYTPVYDTHSENSFPFSALARIMRRVLSEYGEQILIKTPNNGSPYLRSALVHYLARNRGIHVSADQIVIGSGAEYLYGIIAEAFGENIVMGIENPSYEKIEKVYKSRSVHYESLTLGHDGITSSSLQRSNANILHVTPFRSFPSGVTASASKRAEYVRWALQGDRYIIEDDFESEFSLLRKPEDTIFALSGAQNVIYLNTFSKSISPAFRIGYMVLPEKLLERFNTEVGFYSCTVPTFEQLVLAELIESGSFERHINRIRRTMRLKTELNQIK